MDSSSLPDNRLFAGVPATAVREIADRCTPTSYTAGEFVYARGDDNGSLYVVLEGSVDGLVSAAEHEQSTPDSHAGDFFGEMALIRPGPRDAGARVTEPAMVIRLDPESLEKLLALAPVPLMRNVAHRALERRRSEEENVSKRLEDIKQVVGGLAHDLKNPLGVIQGRMELLRDSISSPAECGDVIKRQCDFALGLVRDFLDVTRGKTEVIMGVVETTDLIRNLEELAPDRIQRNKVHFHKDIRFSGSFRGGTDALTRALLNIFKNAVEATPDGGSVTIATEMREGHVEITVADTGPGIAPEVKDVLFEPFKTFGKRGGTGFGMTITRSIAAAHGGEVTILKSDSTGTTFALIIPRTEPGPPKPR